MSGRVQHLHHITVEFSLGSPDDPPETDKRRRRHRFLYGVQTWIPAVDHKFEGLVEGDTVELLVEPETLGAIGLAVEAAGASPVKLAVRIVEVRMAEPREVIKALAATVHCCDQCEGH